MAYLIRFLTNKVAPVKVAAFKGVNKSFRGGDVCCNGNVMNVAKTKKSCIVIIRVLVHGITEEKQKIDFVAGNSGSYLFTAAVASAEETGNFKAGCIRNKFSGSGSGTEFVLSEDSAISDAELDHKFFFCVLCNNCNIH